MTIRVMSGSKGLVARELSEIINLDQNNKDTLYDPVRPWCDLGATRYVDYRGAYNEVTFTTFSHNLGHKPTPCSLVFMDKIGDTIKALIYPNAELKCGIWGYSETLKYSYKVDRNPINLKFRM